MELLAVLVLRWMHVLQCQAMILLSSRLSLASNPGCHIPLHVHLHLQGVIPLVALMRLVRLVRLVSLMGLGVLLNLLAPLIGGTSVCLLSVEESDWLILLLAALEGGVE